MDQADKTKGQRKRILARIGWGFVAVLSVAAILEDGWRSGFPSACLSNPLLSNVVGSLVILVPLVAQAALMLHPPRFVNEHNNLGTVFLFGAGLIAILCTFVLLSLQFFEFGIYCSGPRQGL